MSEGAGVAERKKGIRGSRTSLPSRGARMRIFHAEIQAGEIRYRREKDRKKVKTPLTTGNANGRSKAKAPALRLQERGEGERSGAARWHC